MAERNAYADDRVGVVPGDLLNVGVALGDAEPCPLVCRGNEGAQRADRRSCDEHPGHGLENAALAERAHPARDLLC